MSLTTQQINASILQRLHERPLTEDFGVILGSILDAVSDKKNDEIITELVISAAINGMQPSHRLARAIGCRNLDYVMLRQLPIDPQAGEYQRVILGQRQWLIDFLQHFKSLDFSQLPCKAIHFNPMLVITHAGIKQKRLISPIIL